MNNQRRKELQKALDLIEEAKQIVESIKDEEQESFDNLSDNLQGSEKGEMMSNNVDSLDIAISELERALDNINESIE